MKLFGDKFAIIFIIFLSTTNSLQLLTAQYSANVGEEDDSDGGFRHHYSKPVPQRGTAEANTHSQLNHSQYGPQFESHFSGRSRAKVKLHQSLSSGPQDINRSSIRANIYGSTVSVNASPLLFLLSADYRKCL